MANQGVRDVGTLAGNLALLRLSKAVPDFPSDVALLMEAVGVIVHVAQSDKKKKGMSVEQFLQLEDMDRKIITNITFPKLSENHIFR